MSCSPELFKHFTCDTSATFGTMPDKTYFEADGYSGNFVKWGAMAEPSRIVSGLLPTIQPIADAELIMIDPATPVRYASHKK